MTSDEIKAVWAEKITSLEMFNTARAKTRHHCAALSDINAAPFTQRTAEGVSVSTSVEDTWFLRREASREAVGVYPEATSVLTWMRANGCNQYFPHVSTKDAAMVAFTPDRQSGQADRQVPTTMGKLLRKFFLVLTDAEVARLEALHRAEMDGSFELATTSDAIQAAFAVAGDSSCMRYDKSHWNLRDYHPSAVYCAPGMGLAVTRNAAGDVNARSVVWTNPADPADKRYVRIYGDQALKRRLEKAGYRMAGLAGAQLAALKDSAHPDDYVMPWIDPAGGIYGSPASRAVDSSMAVKYKGEDFIRLITDDQARQFSNAGLSVASVRQQGGRIHLVEIDAALLSYTCAISGQPFDRMATRTVKWLTDAGVTAQASQDAMTTHLRATGSMMYTLDRTVGGSGTEKCYCTQETYVKYGIPGFEGCFNDAATRAHIGVVQLDVSLYGENQFAKKRDCAAVEGLGWVKTPDGMRVFDAAGEERYEHIGAVKALRKQGYVATAVIGRVKAMSHTGNPALVVTVGGRKTLKGHHAVIELHDGRWDYAANTHTAQYLNTSITTPKAERIESVRLTAEQVDRQIGQRLRASASNNQLRSRATEWLTHVLAVPAGRRYPTYFIDPAHGDSLSERAHYRDSNLEHIEAAVARLEQLAADPVQLAGAVGTWNAPGASFWAHHARLVLSLYHTILAERASVRAEDDEHLVLAA